MQHAQLTIKQVSGSTAEIREEVYTDKLKSVTVKTEQKILSSESTLLADYIKCLGVIRNHSTDELTVNIKHYSNGDVRIIKTWTVNKESV